MYWTTHKSDPTEPQLLLTVPRTLRSCSHPWQLWIFLHRQLTRGKDRCDQFWHPLKPQSDAFAKLWCSSSKPWDFVYCQDNQSQSWKIYFFYFGKNRGTDFLRRIVSFIGFPLPNTGLYNSFLRCNLHCKVKFWSLMTKFRLRYANTRSLCQTQWICGTSLKSHG